MKICCGNFSEISLTRKTLLKENFDLTTNFDSMTNFDFFWPNNYGVAHGKDMKFGL